MIRGFCEYVSIFDLIDTFIDKAILDTHEVFSVSSKQYLYDSVIS
jgi:hypothetical protein